MNISIVASILLIFFHGIFHKSEGKEPHKIIGSILENMEDGDTIYFIPVTRTTEYYSTTDIKSVIKNNTFEIDNIILFPQIFRIRYYSEKEDRVWRPMYYILDSTVRNITIDSIDNREITYSKNQDELLNVFFPFLENKSKLFGLQYLSELKDSTDINTYQTFLEEYTRRNPSSYVALWLLIFTFDEDGHSIQIEKILNQFSSKLKNDPLFKKIKNNIENYRIKEGQKFPDLMLRDTNLNQVTLPVGKSEYILVNYWFSRCKPCLAKIPELTNFYSSFQGEKFEIINIATDTERYFLNLKKTIKSFDLKWPQYVDLNALEAQKDNIYSYPTNFLLNKHGVVIGKDVDFVNLKRILSQ